MNAVSGAVDGMRCAVGPAFVLSYLLQGLFHPARKVREVFWRLYNALYIGSQVRLGPPPATAAPSAAPRRCAPLPLRPVAAGTC